MVWVKIDDSILDNPKIIRSGPVGFALHTAAITWCARNLTDGFVPEAKAKQLLSKSWADPADDTGREVVWELNAGSGHAGRDADEVIESVILLLVHVGLWHEGTDDYGNLGYWLNDFTQFNPTRAEVLRKRTVRAEAGRAGGEQTQSKRQAKPQAKRKQTEQQNSTPVPDPDPVPKEEEERSSSSPDYTNSDTETVIPLDLVERAERAGVFSDVLRAMPGVTADQLRDKARSFVAYWTIGGGTGKRRRHWMAKLREELRKAHEQNLLRPPGAIEHDPRNGSAPTAEQQRKHAESVRRMAAISRGESPDA